MWSYEEEGFGPLTLLRPEPAPIHENHLTKPVYLVGLRRSLARILEYPVSDDARVAAELCRQVLEELCAVTQAEGLDFTFGER